MCGWEFGQAQGKPAQDEVALATQLLERLCCLDAAQQAVQIVGVILERPCSTVAHMFGLQCYAAWLS